jgi:hypothetical protein
MAQINADSGGLLTNVEVLSHLEELHKKQGRGNAAASSQVPAVEFIYRSVTRYINSTPTSGHTIAAALRQKNALIEMDIGLTEAEIMQLLNHRPKYAVEVHMVTIFNFSYINVPLMRAFIDNRRMLRKNIRRASIEHNRYF